MSATQLNPTRGRFLGRLLIDGIRRGRKPLLSLIGAAALVLSNAGPSTAQAQSTPRWVQNAADTPVRDHWMADLGGGHLGSLRLGEVILPASHDSATYGFLSGWVQGPDPVGFATNQDIDVYTQLQHGIRVLDLRGRNISGTWANPATAQTKQLPQDYYVFHGKDSTDLPLAAVLDDVARWVLAPGHEKEVVIVKVAVDNGSSGPTPRLAELCGTFKEKLGGVLLRPQTFAEYYATVEAQRQRALANNANPFLPKMPVPDVPEFPNLGRDLARYTLNEVWSLPGHQRIILQWDGCVDAWPPSTFNSYWANQCYAEGYLGRPGLKGALQGALNGRLSALNADGLDNGLGKIPTQPSTMPPGRPTSRLHYTGGTIAPGTYWVGYSWLSPVGESSVGRRYPIMVPPGNNTYSIEIEPAPFPPGVTGAAIYLSQDLSNVAYAYPAGSEAALLGVADMVLSKQGETTPTEMRFKLTAPPTNTGKQPTTSDQIGFTRDPFGRVAPVGFYSLGAHATITPECAFPVYWFVDIEQARTLESLKSWFDNEQHNARKHLNIVSADFVQKSKLMEYVLQMNSPSQD
jgi:hypothetical protein